MTPSAASLTPEQRAAVLDLIDREFGIRASEYGASRLDAAILEVLPTTGHATADDLLATLSPDSGSQPKWVYDLVEYLTVGETYFLRDPAQIAALRETILPDLVVRRSSDRRLRIWSAGCSTGEEPYTLAILLREKHIADWDVQLIGTDVNRESLRMARDGRYPAWSFRATPEHVRDRYFEPVEHAWRIIEPIRRMARFAWMNLGAEVILPPAADLDLIVCRNVTIYFDDEATQRLYRALIQALAPGGWLMLGPSDPLPAHRGDLERVDVKETVAWRRTDGAPAARPQVARRHVPTRVEATPPQPVPVHNGNLDLEAGLLALESGSASTALEWLRRATFRDPSSVIGQFALARTYLAVGDMPRAHAALMHTRRLLAPFTGDELVAGSDDLPVETLRQAIDTYLESTAA
jgi:chemotaxis methyl-accepting protein methylase